jgi:xylono-1,5-lactonase
MECIADSGAILGEGPMWDARTDSLYWVDIYDRAVFRWHEGEGYRKIATSEAVCSMLPRASGGFIGGGYNSFIAIDAEYAIERLAAPERDSHPGNRFNDGKIDREGRFWAGTMDRAEKEASGSLYRLDPEMRWSRVDSGYRVTNGPAFSPDGRTMYHADSAIQRIYAFDLSTDGVATNRRLFAQFEEAQGYPDGMTVDVEGSLWVAFWAGWCVRRISPAGEILEEVDVPVACPTSCVFGGAALDQMFITSARRDMAPEDTTQPLAGGVFRFTPGVKGIAELPFAG